MKTVKLGVIGCGVIGSHHIAAAATDENIDLVAVSDINKDRAEAEAKKHGVPKAYGDGAELLADDNVEAIVLAFPTVQRTPLAFEALKRGKHVLLEKPVAVNAGVVQQLMDARGDLTVGCCSSRFQFLAYHPKVRQTVCSGALGQVRQLRILTNDGAGPCPEVAPMPWRFRSTENGGGLLLDWGCYDLDYMLSACGWQLKPKTVLGRAWQIAPHVAAHLAPNSDGETHFVALIFCEGGEVISMDRGQFMAVKGQELGWEIIGTKGSIRQPIYPNTPDKVYHDETTAEKGLVTHTLFEGDPNAGEVHAGPVKDFAAAIVNGRPPATGLEESMVIQKISDAIYESSRKLCAVDIK